ncbi:hypothetical protein SMACR_03003 [Sordaria macrospora]|uniref:WD-like domain-containing protein n=1 Tax=Sordaria macrospora TaxID=5147 RepID=A0A8S9A060_SORMA|nr:hypothetical protein SMACR_03003 [Sordaria macrospora]WPJ58362.1 hypothetical protein SMAC4_03003 [Sordaria macrospora]
MFSKQILIAAAFLATLSTAAPATGSASSDTTALKIDVPEGLKILEQYETKSGGTVVWFGDENPVNATNTVVPDEASTHALNRRCGSNRVACYGDHQTFMPTCEVMTLDTSVLLRDTPIPPSPRSICFYQRGATCCVSWADNVSGAVYRHLINGANAVRKGCPTRWASGKSYDTLIGRTCTTQCLSDRPNGCNSN